MTVAPRDSDRLADFIRTQTRLMAPPLVPEIRLHLSDAITPLWQATEDTLKKNGMAPPYWAFPWVGGLAISAGLPLTDLPLIGSVFALLGLATVALSASLDKRVRAAA